MNQDERLELIASLAGGWDWKVILQIGRLILERTYPADIFDGSSGDTGPAYIVALREALKNINA